jgi:hypothetical protein
MGSQKAPHAKRYEAFRLRLRRGCVEAGLTQQQIAERPRRPQTLVSKCQLGKRRMDFVELEAWGVGSTPLDWFSTRPRKG